MQQEQKESFIGGIIKQLIATFGFELLDKVFHNHKEALKLSSTDPCPSGKIRNSNGDCVDDPGI